MKEITIKFSDEKYTRAKKAFAKLHSITMEDKGTEKEGEEHTPDMQPKFTRSEWLEKQVRRYIKKQIARIEQKELDSLE